MTPIATAYIIDSVIPNHEGGHLIELGLALAVLGGTAFVVNYVSTLAFTRAESCMGRAVQSGIMDRVLRKFQTAATIVPKAEITTRDERGKTAKLLVDLVASLMGKRVMDRPTLAG